MEKYMKTCIHVFMNILNMKAQKHARFHVNFPFNAYIMIKGLVKDGHTGPYPSSISSSNLVKVSITGGFHSHILQVHTV